MQEEMLAQSHIFNGLTRPATFMGIDYDFFYLACLVVLLVFIFSDSFLALLLYPPLHISGAALSKLDPAIFKLLSIRANLGSSRNKSLWQYQSYEVF